MAGGQSVGRSYYRLPGRTAGGKGKRRNGRPARRERNGRRGPLRKILDGRVEMAEDAVGIGLGDRYRLDGIVFKHYDIAVFLLAQNLHLVKIDNVLSVAACETAAAEALLNRL